MEVIARPLKASAFAPFGQVLEAPAQGLRRDHAAALYNGRAGAAPNLGILCPEPATLPLRVSKLERHPLSSQAFVPLRVSRYVVVVCPPRVDDTPDLDRLVAFTADGTQGINYEAGVWHHPMTALDSPGTFAILTWQDGSDADTEWASVETDVVVLAP